MSNTRSLYLHPFVARALDDAMTVRNRLVIDPQQLDADFAREMDEHEFYVIRVAQSVGGLLTCCEQMEHAVEFLSDFSYSERMRRQGIKRHHHFLYNLENCIIRTQILYERLLQLVNRVFHLLNEPWNCTHSVITQNLKVARTDIPELLKAVRKPLLRYQPPRNEIVHRESYTEDELHRLQMLYFVDHLPDQLEGDRGDEVVSPTDAFRSIRAQKLGKIVSEKRGEFKALNGQVITLLVPLLSALESVYERERKRLNGVIGPL